MTFVGAGYSPDMLRLPKLYIQGINNHPEKKMKRTDFEQYLTEIG